MTLKPFLAASLGLLAMQAHGMTLSSRGVGQVLIYPYYTVNNHQQTLFSLTNATEKGKALQVTFREAYDGRLVYAQEVYLGANQSWAANVFALRDVGIADDGVGITSDSKACVQSVTGSAASTTGDGLIYHRFDAASYTGAHADGGPLTPDRQHEGYIEVIELGALAGGTELAISPSVTPSPDCSAVVPSLKIIGDVLAPSGGLSGSAAVVNVPQGTYFGFEPKAIDGFRKQRIVPPAFADLSMAGSEVDLAISASIDYDGTFLTASFPRKQAIDAVSALFMASALTGEFDNSSDIGAATDWVLTFPTKRFYVGSTPVGIDNRPFDKAFEAAPAGVSPVASDYRAYARDGYDLVRNWCGFGECAPITPVLNYQTQVVSFYPQQRADKSSNVLGSHVATFAPVASDSAGFATIEFVDGHMNVSNEGYTLIGLPVIGVQAINYVKEDNAGNALSNYSGTAPLRATLNCEAPAGCR